MSRRRLLILLHENDPHPSVESGMIWCLLPHWLQADIEVQIIKGVSRRVDADLVFPHLDLTRMPDDYLAFWINIPASSIGR